MKEFGTLVHYAHAYEWVEASMLITVDQKIIENKFDLETDPRIALGLVWSKNVPDSADPPTAESL